MAKKEEVVEVLKIILDGLTAGESSKKDLDSLQKERDFLIRVIRVIAAPNYVEQKRVFLSRGPIDASRVWKHYQDFPRSLAPDSSSIEPLPYLDGYDTYIEQLIEAAKRDPNIGIKEEK